MKKNILYGLTALAGILLASCNGDYDDWASPQSYDAEAAAAKYGVSFSNGPEAISVMPDADGMIDLVTLTASSDAVSGFSVTSLKVDGIALDATVSGNTIQVNAYDLDTLVENHADSRAAIARSFSVVSDVSVNLSNGDAISVGTGTTSGSLTPAAVPAIDETGYYMLGAFEGNGWDPTKPLWMEEDSDGVYKATITTSGDGDNYFGFYAGSNFVSGDWDEINKGAIGSYIKDNSAMHGFVAYKGDPLYGDNVNSMIIKGQGTYEVTLDMNNLTYTIKRSESMYYIIGNPQGWDTSDITCLMYAEGSNIYSYTTKFTNQYDLKFVDAKNMNKGNDTWGYCFGGVNGSTDASGSLVYGSDAGAIGPSTTGGWYTFRVNMTTLTYTWTQIDEPTTSYTHVSLIGDFNSWGGDVDLTELTKAPHNWYVRATIPSDGGLKFRANHAWATSWGTTSDSKDTPIGDTYFLPTGSENITVPAGTYDFYLNDITGLWCIVPVE